MERTQASMDVGVLGHDGHGSRISERSEPPQMALEEQMLSLIPH